MKASDNKDCATDPRRGFDRNAAPNEAPPERQGMAESLRKALFGSLSTLFMTEEGARNSLSEMRLPKEAVSFVLQQTEKTRREIFRMLGQEVKNAAKTIDFRRELYKILAQHKLVVRAEISFEDAKPALNVVSAVRKKKPTMSKKDPSKKRKAADGGGNQAPAMSRPIDSRRNANDASEKPPPFASSTKKRL